jgi:uncharacterized membrane protein YqiK
VDESGNVDDAEIAGEGGSNQFKETALAAARKMKFRAPGRRVAAKVTILFTDEGSDFDRQARQRKAQNERDRQQRELARQQQERDRLEREREAQNELARQQQERDRQTREREAQNERDRQAREREAQNERDRQQQQEKIPLTPP